MRRFLSLALALLAPLAAAQTVTLPGLLDGRAYASETQMQIAQTLHLSVAGQTQDMTMTNTTQLFQSMQAARTPEGWTVTLTTHRTVGRGESPQMDAPLVMDTDRPDELPAEQREALMATIEVPAVLLFDPSFRLRRPVAASAGNLSMQAEGFSIQAGPRALGEVWTDSMVMTMSGIPNNVVTTYTLREVVGDSARLTYTQTLRGDGPIRAPGVPETMNTRLALTGTGEGTARIHLGNGGMRTEGTTTMQGVMEMSGPGLEAPMTMGISSDVRSLQATRPKD